MTYEKPEMLELGRAEEVVLEIPKSIGDIDFFFLPRNSLGPPDPFDD